MANNKLARSSMDLALKPTASHDITAGTNGDLGRTLSGGDPSGQAVDLGSKDEKRPGYWKQTRVLMARSHKNVYRNYPLLIGFVGQGIILGVVIGVTYYQLPEVGDG